MDGTSNSVKPVVVKQRLVLFDLLRIVSIFMIAIAHIGFPVQQLLPIINYPNSFLTYHLSSGAIGVYLLVFVSGAVLHNSYLKRNALHNYLRFVLGRFERVYPAYWLMLLLTSLIAPSLILTGWHLVAQISGFLPYLVYYAWWIGLFVALSIVFPVVSEAMKRRPHVTLAAAFVVSIASRLIVRQFNGDMLPGFDTPLLRLDRVFVTCLIFEFALGMYVVQRGWLMWRHNNTALTYVSDLSYYVFLCHVPVFAAFYTGDPKVFWQPASFGYYLVIMVAVSMMLKISDEKMQERLRQLHRRWLR